MQLVLARPGCTLSRVWKPPAFTLRRAQGERVGSCNQCSFPVRAEPVEARDPLFQHPILLGEGAERRHRDGGGFPQRLQTGPWIESSHRRTAPEARLDNQEAGVVSSLEQALNR